MNSDYRIHCRLCEKGGRRISDLMKRVCEVHEIQGILAALAILHGSALALDILTTRCMTARPNHIQECLEVMWGMYAMEMVSVCLRTSVHAHKTRENPYEISHMLFMSTMIAFQ